MRKLFLLSIVLSFMLASCGTPQPPVDNDPPADNDTTTMGRGLTFTDPEVYGAVPRYQPAIGFGAGSLPDRVDLSETGKFPEPGDQGAQQSCTAWACAYALKTFQEATEGAYTPTSSSQVFSPSFPYYFTNRAQGDATQCVGAAVTTLKTVMDLLKTRGAATLATMSYDPMICAEPPSQAALDEAKNYTIRDYARLTNKDEIRRALSEGNPVVIGIVIGTTFMQANGSEWTLAGYQADLNDSNAGGHAFIIVGYDDNAKTFKVMNSWSTNWGTNGYWEISYDVIDLATDLLAQGQTLFELWVTWDNVSDTPVAPDEVVDTADTDPPTGEDALLELANVSFTVDAVDADSGTEGVSGMFDLTVDESLAGEELVVILTVVDAATDQILPDRDGEYAYDGFVAQSGSIYLSDVFSFTEASLFLPYDELDLESGTYQLTPAIVVSTLDGTQSSVVFAAESFELNLLLPQVNTGIPIGEYTGVDSDDWYVDFIVEDDGSVFGSLMHPTKPYFFETIQSGFTEQGDVYMQFDIGDFEEGVTCEYLGGFTSKAGGEGIWECNNGWQGTWTFEPWDSFFDFDEFDNFSDWDSDYNFFDEDWVFEDWDDFEDLFDDGYDDFWNSQDDYDWSDFDDFDDFDDYYDDYDFNNSGWDDFWDDWENDWYNDDYNDDYWDDDDWYDDDYWDDDDWYDDWDDSSQP